MAPLNVVFVCSGLGAVPTTTAAGSSGTCACGTAAVGNEGGVTNAVNNLGLLWELAAEWGALLVWAEVRAAGAGRPPLAESDRACPQTRLA